MKTTIEIADPLLVEAKEQAARRGTTLRALVEEGLRQVLRPGPGREIRSLRDASFGGKGLTEEFESRGGWSRLREAAYPGFFDDDTEKHGA